MTAIGGSSAAGDHLDGARLAARSTVRCSAEQRAERARDAHRVPVGQRERDPLGKEPRADRERVRQQTRQQAREGDRGERRGGPSEQHGQISDAGRGAAGQHENQAVQERAIELGQGTRRGVGPDRRSERPDRQASECAGSQCESGTPALEGFFDERDATDEDQRERQPDETDLSREEPTCAKAQPCRRHAQVGLGTRRQGRREREPPDGAGSSADRQWPIHDLRTPSYDSLEDGAGS